MYAYKGDILQFVIGDDDSLSSAEFDQKRNFVICNSDVKYQSSHIACSPIYRNFVRFNVVKLMNDITFRAKVDLVSYYIESPEELEEARQDYINRPRSELFTPLED